MPYDKIPYASFLWKFGTTSFRTTEFNYMTEKQLDLLNKFWQDPKFANQGWESKYMAPGQDDIYQIKVDYYDYLVEQGFMSGGEPWERKYKTAREKTSGLYDMGLINENHRLTEVGLYLLELAKTQQFNAKTDLGISPDSLLYLGQLLKLSLSISGSVVRPFIIITHLLSQLGYLTYDEFRYLAPLCIDNITTSNILGYIRDLRKGNNSIDNIIKDVLLSKDNYRLGLERFSEENFSEDLLLSVSMNRKSSLYDRNYVTLYNELHAVYMDDDSSRIVPLFESLKKFQSSISIKWKQLLFDTSLTQKIKREPQAHILPLSSSDIESEKNFKKFFFLTMHLFKAKATLEDYLDLNRRYLGLTNCFLFDDEQVKFDIVPKQFFNSADDALFKQAFQSTPLLEKNCKLSDICPSLIFEKNKIIDGINKDLGTNLSSMEQAYNEVDRLRYERFNKLVEVKFSNETLLSLLDAFDSRRDDDISRMVTDNADIPTIFEYVLGIIWYKVSGNCGKVLEYLKLSLDANLLPITHAAGGEADIVWEYNETVNYPKHSLLLEATLADSTNQRRMEMEPVSRHLGNHLLKTHNPYSYCIFATSFLHINVISDFRNRKNSYYCDQSDPNNCVEGMKIIPLNTTDLREIVKCNLQYPLLYRHFQKAYQSTEMHPQRWYTDYVAVTPTISHNN